jgi:hypothetical protein
MDATATVMKQVHITANVSKKNMSSELPGFAVPANASCLSASMSSPSFSRPGIVLGRRYALKGEFPVEELESP